MKCKLKREILNDIATEETEEPIEGELPENRRHSDPQPEQSQIRHGHSKTENSGQLFQKVASETVSFHNTIQNSQALNEANSVSKEEIILKENEVH